MGLRSVFWSKVRVAGPHDCWEWGAGRFPKGYGASSRLCGTRIAHRIAYSLCIGPIPEGLQVLHTCDNPPCCNPGHLFPGTNADNVRDRVAKGRNRSRPNPRSCYTFAKLTEDQVREIDRRCANGERQDVVASDYGVSSQTVSAIVTRQRWKHLFPPVTCPVG